MTQVAPTTASDDVTVVIFTPKDDTTDKHELVAQSVTRRQKIVVGVLYTLVSFLALYIFVAGVSFFGDVFTLLLVMTRGTPLP
ncbi:hypothetical protein PRNP1_012080 [Phytophthora ramorum]|uniref:uncharacterized protein n=1 Tax=Phytophthora ramorum TaxID=164328 RepID=UPI0030A9DDD1|nr:hypothetical protein KRP23_9628 [Phytophthora ramorum]